MLDFATQIVKRAGEKLLELSKDTVKYSMKNRHDILAEADLASEKIIIDSIRSKFPGHAILSEEAGADTKSSEYLWIIDPLDGTIGYARGLDEYCVVIALQYRNQEQFSLIYQPTTEKLYMAEKGKGAFLNGKQIHVSNEEKLINMILGLECSSEATDRKKNFDILANVCTDVRHARIFGSGSIQLARIAEGKTDIFYRIHFLRDKIKYWDYAPGALLVQEAGGEVTDLQGALLNRNSTSVIASNGKVHKEILTILNQHSERVREAE